MNLLLKYQISRFGYLWKEFPKTAGIESPLDKNVSSIFLNGILKTRDNGIKLDTLDILKNIFKFYQTWTDEGIKLDTFLITNLWLDFMGIVFYSYRHLFKETAEKRRLQGANVDDKDNQTSAEKEKTTAEPWLELKNALASSLDFFNFLVENNSNNQARTLLGSVHEIYSAYVNALSDPNSWPQAQEDKAPVSKSQLRYSSLSARASYTLSAFLSPTSSTSASVPSLLSLFCSKDNQVQFMNTFVESFVEVFLGTFQLRFVFIDCPPPSTQILIDVHLGSILT